MKYPVGWCPGFALALALFFVVPAARPATTAVAGAANRPNIVFILADDLGYGDVKCLNPEGKIATPHLDRLAAGGMIFTEAHSSSAVCTPSRYSILTGRYSWRSSLKQGVLGGFSPPLIEPGRLTVAELLRQQGYHTAAVGKWHLGLAWARKPGAAGESTDENLGRSIDFTQPIGRGPTTLGFNEYFGISASLDMPPYTFIEGDRVTVLPVEERTLPWIDAQPTGKQTRRGPAAPGFEAASVLPALTQCAVDYVSGRAKAARAGQPFFLYVPLTSPHTPIAPGPAWNGQSGLNPYADFVMATDAAVGDLLAALDREGLTKDTLVIFTSDNGCSPEADYPFLKSRQHDPSARRRGHKADIYDGGHRVPFIVRWPARVAAGSQSEAFISLGDFVATCADIVGAKLPENAAEDSISYLPVVEGRAGAQQRETLVLHSINGSFGLRQGRWKLEFCPDSGGWSFPRPGKDDVAGRPRFQLFDLERDPAEQENVVNEHADVVQRLGRAMRHILVNGRSTPGPAQANATSDRWPQAAWLDQFK